MHGMIENLLCLARADSNQVKPQLATFELKPLLEQTWHPFAPTAANRSIRVDWMMPAELLVQTDRERLAQVLTNLFDNAVHYVNEKGTIAIGAAANNGSVQLTISNSGSRVPETQADRVFDRFWRGDTSRTGDGARSGLGLSVCKRLVALMGGSIKANSTVGGTFAVQLILPAQPNS
jgi:signal transduction histidine kinase